MQRQPRPAMGAEFLMFDSDSLVPAGKTGLLILLAGLFAASPVMAVEQHTHRRRTRSTHPVEPA